MSQASLSRHWRAHGNPDSVPKPIPKPPPKSDRAVLEAERRAHVAEIRDLRLSMKWHRGLVAELAERWDCSTEHVNELVRVVDAFLAEFCDPQAWTALLGDYARRGLERIYSQEGKFDALGAAKMVEVILKLTGVAAPARVDLTSGGKALGALPAQAEALLGELLALNPTPEEVETFSATGVLPKRAPRTGSGSNGAPTQH